MGPQVKEGLEGAVGGKKNVVFLHDISSGCDLQEEIAKAPEEIKKAMDKTFKDNRFLVYSEDLMDESNDMLLSKCNLKVADDVAAIRSKRLSEKNIAILKYSAKVSKARMSA